MDKKGRPCKERLLQILARQKIDGKVLTEVVEKNAHGGDSIQKHDAQKEGEPIHFTFKKADRLLNCFSNTKLENLMQQLFPY